VLAHGVSAVIFGGVLKANKVAMSDPQVTIVVVPRERFSHSERSCQHL